ncbi:hypothetical protein RhiirA5_384575 [Rhizophagus irregularis]|uniref:Uncharacterized protein n=1 Tax=Rhizophagus irregularis TaxID=588596 RepID=A0A2I1FGV7_9GLOM|nr:hypothetical protein RhiirA5_384575 [Rhizophagus irregularis]PKY33599.1 hypothetical protein RhiirB3_394929 [Rhizophagus irregularis]
MSAIGKWNPYNYGGQWNAVYLMGHRDTFCDVNAFWNKIELNGQLQDQLQTAEIEAVSSLISVSKKTFATTIRNVHSAIENVNDTLDEIDTFFQGPPNVVKDASRKRRSVKGTGSKSVKRNKSSKKIVVDAGNHPVPSMNIQRTSTIFNTDDAIVDVGQTTCDESELPVEAEKAEKSKTIFSWEHVVDKLKISDKSDHDVLCLSSIIYVKEDKLKYLKCSEQIWQDALPKPLIPSELPVSAQLNIMQYSRVSPFSISGTL